METFVDGMDPGGTLLFVEDALRSRRQAEYDDLRLAVLWADFHADDPREWPVERQFPGMARLVLVGGVGTPRVQDLCLHELAVSRQAHPMATRWLMADALDLVHRLPRCWAVVGALACEAWVARKVARLTRDLSEGEAAGVDAAVAVALAGEQPSVVLEVAEAKVIEANPGLHERKVKEARERRFVSVGRMDAAGLRHVIARVEHGDAVWVDALLDRVADILAVEDEAARLPLRSKDARRSVAFGWLARPAELLALLLEHAEDPDPGPTEHDAEDEARADESDHDAASADGGEVDDVGGDDGVGGGEDKNSDAASVDGSGAGNGDESDDSGDDSGDDCRVGEPDPEPDPGPWPDPGADVDPGPRPDLSAEPDDEVEPDDASAPPDEARSWAGSWAGPWTQSWAAAFPAHLLEVLRNLDPAKLRPQAVVYVHLHQAALASSHPTGRGCVVKVEDGGPVLPKHLGSMLGGALVKVTEVVDLNGITPVASYVMPQWLKEQVQLISPRTAFPHSTTISRAVDYDHVEPFQHRRPGSSAPPGQTGLHNAAPLGRSQHRAKTHAGYTVRIPEPGTVVWRTPHQRYRLVDATGTTVINETLGRALFGPSRLEQGLALTLAHHDPAA
ncbi:hypothetical protein ncot_01345 [Nocardioides sp. JQ2195]|uniref:hypothetical protein n=1 Tax=Nocardioides sp. JQ2195 TaxID=2592334 RepID=UPI00143EC2B3|nr:hypothetical protein [Nocardioides sp. JQ2195]QIX25382.1 hypothetical protein ncot_01345 [Nocardioides sp. JQ2195]